jgi:hypothetical protein
MIAQVLNREWVRQQLEDVEQYLSSPATDRRRGATGGMDVSPDDLEEALVYGAPHTWTRGRRIERAVWL